MKIDLAKLNEKLKAKGLPEVESVEALVENIRSKTKETGDTTVAVNAGDDVINYLKEIGFAKEEVKADEKAEAEHEAYNKAKEDGAYEKFQTMNDTEKKDFLEKLSSEMGSHNAALAVTGDSFMKTVVLEPLGSSKTNQTEKTRAMRKLHNQVQIALAARKGIEYTGDVVAADVRRETLNKTLDTFEKYSDLGEYVAEYRKGLNEALDTATSNQGAEFLPTILSSDYIDAIFLDTLVAGQFRRVNMPSKVYDIPAVTNRGRIYAVNESTTNTDFYTNKFTAHQANTSKITLTAFKAGYQAFYSDEVRDDSIISIAEVLDKDLRRAFAEGFDDLVLNGSDSLADLDNAAVSKLFTSATDIRNQADGIRKLVEALSTSYVDGGTLSTAVFNSARATMGKYGARVDDLFIATSPTGYYAMLVLEELETVDKFGQDRATIRNGVINKLYGIDVIMSDEVYENLNASGVYDNLVTDNTVAVLCHRDALIWGDRRLMTVERDRMVTSQQNVLVGHWRGDLVAQYPSTETVAAVVRNIPV